MSFRKSYIFRTNFLDTETAFDKIISNLNQFRLKLFHQKQRKSYRLSFRSNKFRDSFVLIQFESQCNSLSFLGKLSRYKWSILVFRLLLFLSNVGCCQFLMVRFENCFCTIYIYLTDLWFKLWIYPLNQAGESIPKSNA